MKISYPGTTSRHPWPWGENGVRPGTCPIPCAHWLPFLVQDSWSSWALTSFLGQAEDDACLLVHSRGCCFVQTL